MEIYLDFFTSTLKIFKNSTLIILHHFYPEPLIAYEISNSIPSCKIFLLQVIKNFLELKISTYKIFYLHNEYNFIKKIFLSRKIKKKLNTQHHCLNFLKCLGRHLDNRNIPKKYKINVGSGPNLDNKANMENFSFFLFFLHNVSFYFLLQK